MSGRSFDDLSQDFLGLRAPSTVVTEKGQSASTPSIYLDSAATCLMPRPVWGTIGRYLEASCANPHTHASSRSRETTTAIERVHGLVKQFFSAGPQDTVILTGSGATEPTNLLASAMFSAGDPRDVAIISSIEHHSNLLPWMRSAPFVAYVDALSDGTLDLGQLQALLTQYRGRVRVVAITAVSNVTGYIPPLYAISHAVHDAGADLVVDVAQASAHIPIAMHSTYGDIDYIVFSGHKMYAPGSPGGLVGRKDLFTNYVGQVGGGMIERVELGASAPQGKVWYKSDPSERQEAGTPNVPGTVGLGAAIELLSYLGMQNVRSHEIALITYALKQLSTVPELVVYGPTDVNQRGGVISFNLSDLPHGIVAAALNDYFAIAVRNDCFCAQPYVRSQLEASCNVTGMCAPSLEVRKGMVRASMGLYTIQSDIDALVGALKWIYQRRGILPGMYVEDDGVWTHRFFRSPVRFDLDSVMGKYLGKM